MPPGEHDVLINDGSDGKRGIGELLLPQTWEELKDKTEHAVGYAVYQTLQELRQEVERVKVNVFDSRFTDQDGNHNAAVDQVLALIDTKINESLPNEEGK